MSHGQVTLQHVSITFTRDGQSIDAVQDVSLTIQPGEFVALLGASGCGKSTLLNAVAGFVTPSQGQVYVDGERISKPGADRGMVFQQHALFPWKTVQDNVEFGLKMRGMARKERREIAANFLHLVGLDGFAHMYPAQLSGGMQQRVGLARVLVNQPRVMLMDEPFAALDAQSRLLMQELLLHIWQEIRTTVIFVTHDVDEAIFLSDRIAVMSARPGRIKQELQVPLARPRTPEMTANETYMRLKLAALTAIREESFQAASNWREALTTSVRRDAA